MRLNRKIGLLAAGVMFASGMAQAQNNTATSGNSTGITSGPASQTGHSATLGSGGHSPATPHQSDALQNHGNPNAGAGAGLGAKPTQQ